MNRLFTTLIFSVLAVVMLFLRGFQHFPKISRTLPQHLAVESKRALKNGH
ncbi:hypothetical protein [Candidatus Nitrotoga sp. BS]|nr:hypothetical protein [Candidatus Nitrotoga sp. BS]